MKRVAIILMSICLLATPVMAEETASEMPSSIEDLWEMYLDLLARVEMLEEQVEKLTASKEEVLVVPTMVEEPETSAITETETNTIRTLSSSGEKFEFTVIGVSEYYSFPGYFGRTVEPEDGKVFLLVEIEAHNITDTDLYINSFNYDAYVDGYSVEANPDDIDDVSIDIDLLSGDLRAGKRMIGSVCVEADSNWEELEINYEESWGGNAITLIVTPDDITE